MSSRHTSVSDFVQHHQASGLPSPSSSSSTLDTTSSNINDSTTNLFTASANSQNDHTNYHTTYSIRCHSSVLQAKNHNQLPFGILFLRKISPWTLSDSTRLRVHKSLVLIVTFVAYTAFHIGRRPLAVVKAELHHHHSGNSSTNNTQSNRQLHISTNNTNDWAPFDRDEDQANKLFGYLDTAFLSSYAICMFFSGVLAERMNLRYFISVGCALSGLGLIAAGLARTLEIHSLSYFIAVQVFSGAMQSTGWPVVVTCVGNWLAKSERGLIYGLWNSHTNLGNVLGALICGAIVKQNWGLSFIVPGFIMIAVALIQWLFLVAKPSYTETTEVQSSDHLNGAEKSKSINSIASFDSSVSVESDSMDVKRSDDNRHTGSSSIFIQPSNKEDNSQAVSFVRAICIPGVVEYSLCLYFSKLVSYTFLYWLPKYLEATRQMDSKDSAFQSVWFDIGGISGAIVAGLASDLLGKNGLICGTMLLGAIPAMFIFQSITNSSLILDGCLQALVGAFVNGPYCLITTSVSVDLGDRIKDGQAMATVAAIIDGMGSLGAVAGPLLAGLITKSDDWTPVFTMLITSNAMATICLARIISRELKDCFCSRQVQSIRP